MAGRRARVSATGLPHMLPRGLNRVRAKYYCSLPFGGFRPSAESGAGPFRLSFIIVAGAWRWGAITKRILVEHTKDRRCGPETALA